MPRSGGGEDKKPRNSNSLRKEKAILNEETKRTKVHAQRKFAQGAGGLSPQVSPVKEVRPAATRGDNGNSSSSSSSGPSILPKGERPKTEDFLTFLCLRGTEYLPPELDFFNQATVPNHGGTSDDSFAESDEDKKDPEVDKNGVAKKSVAKKTPKAGDKSKKIESPLKNMVRGRLLSRGRSQDSASSVETRRTRSKADTDVKTKVAKTGRGGKSGKEVSDRGLRARTRGINKEKEESESSDDSSSEVEDKDEKSECEDDADEELEPSSRESSMKPSRESSTKPISRRSRGVVAPSSLTKSPTSTVNSPKDVQKSAARPSRKTKEAAKNYLNLLGQKLTGRRRDEEETEEIPIRQSKETVVQRKEPKKEEDEEVKEEEGGQDSPETSSTPDADSKGDEERSNDSGGKSPKGAGSGDRKNKEKKEKKEKKKTKTSLKDLQNILLEEAKRKIADTNPVLSGINKQICDSPVDSDTPDSEERFTISQKTGYINVKPRPSVEQDDLRESSSPIVRRGSLPGPSRRLSKSSSERTCTPPRKILPKTEECERTVESPAGRTNHLPAGVIGAAGLSNRMNVATVAMSKSSSNLAHTSIIDSNALSSSGISFSQPLTIQTSSQGTVKSSYSSVVNVPSSTVHHQTSSSMASMPLNVPDPSSSLANTIIVPTHSNQIRMPLQMATVPVQVQGLQQGVQGIQGVQGLQGVQAARPLQVEVRPNGQLGYQSIPILGPGGVQFGIPVQSNGIPVQTAGIPMQTGGIPVQTGGVAVQSLANMNARPMNPTIVTVPSYIRPGFTYSPLNNPTQQTNTNNVRLNQPMAVSSVISSGGPAAATLPQTITMPSGTTIQYNVTPVSVQQPTTINIPRSAPPLPRTTHNLPRTAAASLNVPRPNMSSTAAGSPNVISTNTSPLLSPGPPTLSPQISTPTRPNLKHMTKLDSGPPMLTPPAKKSESRRSVSSPATQPLLPLQTQGEGSSPKSTPSHPVSTPTPQYSTTPTPAFSTTSTPFSSTPTTMFYSSTHTHPAYSTAAVPMYSTTPASSYSTTPTYSTNPHSMQVTNIRSAPVQTVIRSPTAQYGYAQQHNLYPNMQGVYPAPLQVDPYQSPHPAYQSSPYHQPSPSGSYHSPRAINSPHGSSSHIGNHGGQLSSPHGSQMSSPHGGQLASPHGAQMASPHGAQMASPHGGQISSPHFMGSPHTAPVEPLGSPQYQASYPPTPAAYPHSPVQYNYPSQPPQPVQHSPLTPSISQYRNLQAANQKMLSETKDGDSKASSSSYPSGAAASNPIVVKEEKTVTTTTSTKHIKPEERIKENKSANNHTKKKSEKFGKSKTTAITHKPITHFNVEDDKSSPYAFDFDSDASPQVPFRKSSSPLKPPAMIKRSRANLAGFIGTSSEPSQNSSTSRSSSMKSAEESSQRIKSAWESSPRINSAEESSPRIKTVWDTPPASQSRPSTSREEAKEEKRTDTTEDGSSSDNETTYFIPLQTSGQSFGVAVKLGTDGPSGPNQKVIMTAKLVTNPSKKPMKAKILGSKTTESKVNAQEGEEDVRTNIPRHDTSTPRKVRMPVASPVSPSYPLDANISPISDKPSRPRMRRVDDSQDLGPSTSRGKEPAVELLAGRKRPQCLIGTVNTGNRFPRLGQHAQMMEAPTFRPTEAEFQDPIRYIQKIRRHAEQFGMCKIIPPASFKPECNVEDDLRFTAYNQYINRMFSRWGPNAKETAAIKKYLETQNVDTRAHPLVGGLEIDLPALYHAVQAFGGLSEVIQKKKWGKIAEYLRVARGTHASGNKLDDVYVKWLLPYDTLSSVEREELLRLVGEEWAEQSREKLEKSKQRETDNIEDNQDQEDDEDEDEHEAVVKGKSTSLAAFYRLSRNLLSTVFRDVDNPSPHEAEDEYWKIVSDKDVHMQVCQGSIDTGVLGYGFPIRNSQYASNPWNLKNLTNNQRSILQAMGSVMGVTVPTLHVGMLFTSCCWYRDPHALPWIEYLHTGSSKIWYGIPDHHSLAFYTAMKQLVPSFCKNRKIWLPSDTTMVSPGLLVKHGVSVCRAVQQPGQFLVVFPKSYTSSISTGYNVSESVYFATSDWLNEADTIFQDIKDSMEPMMFPLEKMLFSVSKFKNATKQTLINIKPKIAWIQRQEISLRERVAAAGVKKFERLKVERKGEEDDEYECTTCNANLYLSLIANEDEESTFCLPHGLEHIKNSKKRLRQCKFMYTYSKDELKEVLVNLENRINKGDYAQEPEVDAPLKSEEVEVVEEEDHVDAHDIVPRQRALPTYIKKEAPLISSESDDEEEEEAEEGPQIGPEDYSHFQDIDEEDIPLVEALFMENDEVIRPSSKRRQPTIRKPLTESESESEEEQEEEDDKEAEEEAKPEPAVSRSKKPPVKFKKAEPLKAKKDAKSKPEKRKAEESESEEEEPRKKTKGKREEKEDARKGKESKDAGGKVKGSKRGGKEDEEDAQTAKKLRLSKPDAKTKQKAEEQKKSAKQAAVPPKKTTTPKPSKTAVANTKTAARKKPKEETTRKRRTKKRKAKTMDAADKFNLLDIILTETDDEMPVSASEEESASSSSEDEWK